MRRSILPVLALALLLAPSLVEAQGRGAGMAGMLGQQNPIDLILTRADSLQLGLTAAEVTQLTQIRDELTATNAPHQTALQGILQGLAGGGAPDPSIMGQIQEHSQPIQAANQAALTRVRGMLSADKVAKIDALIAAQPGRGGRGGGRGAGGPG